PRATPWEIPPEPRPDCGIAPRPALSDGAAEGRRPPRLRAFVFESLRTPISGLVGSISPIRALQTKRSPAARLQIYTTLHGRASREESWLLCSGVVGGRVVPAGAGGDPWRTAGPRRTRRPRWRRRKHPRVPRPGSRPRCRRCRPRRETVR